MGTVGESRFGSLDLGFTMLGAFTSLAEDGGVGIGWR